MDAQIHFEEEKIKEIIFCINIAVTVIYNLAMIPIYRSKLAFFEQHRVDKVG